MDFTTSASADQMVGEWNCCLNCGTVSVAGLKRNDLVKLRMEKGKRQAQQEEEEEEKER